jgi:hypothetical protein
MLDGTVGITGSALMEQTRCLQPSLVATPIKATTLRLVIMSEAYPVSCYAALTNIHVCCFR